MEKKDILREKSMRFSIEIIGLYNQPLKKKEYVMSKQLLKCGTSIGANVREAGNAESKHDFIHKLEIAQKECDESLYWLELLNKSEYISEDSYNQYSDQATQLLKIIRSSIMTSKQNLKMITKN
jgi:four helix bundle protein